MRPVAVALTDTHSNKNTVDEVISIILQAIDLCVELNVKNLFHLGDVFTNRTGQGMMELASFSIVLEYAAQNGVKIYAIAGNHDKTDLNSPLSYLEPFKYHPNFNLLPEEEMREIGGLNCHFLSYYPESKSYAKRLGKLAKIAKKNGGFNLLLTHIAVNGVCNNDGSVVKNGVGKKLFKAFDKVMIGHYHDRSKVGKNIYYIGAARQMTFGENDEKGFTVINSDGSHKYVSSEFSVRRKVVVDANNTTRDKVMKRMKKWLRMVDSGDIVRVIFRGTDENLATMPIVELKQAGIDVKTKRDSILRSIDAAVDGEFKVFNYKRVKKEFLLYCQANGIKLKSPEGKAGLQLIQTIEQ